MSHGEDRRRRRGGSVASSVVFHRASECGRVAQYWRRQGRQYRNYGFQRPALSAPLLFWTVLPPPLLRGRLRLFPTLRLLPEPVPVSYTHLRAHETRHDL